MEDPKAAAGAAVAKLTEQLAKEREKSQGNLRKLMEAKKSEKELQKALQALEARVQDSGPAAAEAVAVAEAAAAAAESKLLASRDDLGKYDRTLSARATNPFFWHAIPFFPNKRSFSNKRSFLISTAPRLPDQYWRSICRY